MQLVHLVAASFAATSTVGLTEDFVDARACKSSSQAWAALEKAKALLLDLPNEGGSSPEARDLIMKAVRTCPNDPAVLNEAGEGLRWLLEPQAALALFASATNRGVWRHPLQRIVNGFKPDLRSAAVLRQDAFEELPELRTILDEVQGKWKQFRDEFVIARRKFHSNVRQIQTCAVGTRCGQGPRWREGTWLHYYIAPTEQMYTNGPWLWTGDEEKCNWRGFPKLCAQLIKLRRDGFEVTQVAVSEVLGPRTHIPVHGSEQWRLRLMCPLVVPPNSTSLLIFPGYGAEMFEAGKCWWFDESYEHELFYEGSSFRAALLIDLKHPGLDGRAPKGTWTDDWPKRDLPSGVTELRGPMMYQREWTQIGKHRCWQGDINPNRCCFSDSDASCWNGRDRTFEGCCGTLGHAGTPIERCSSALASMPRASCKENAYMPSKLEMDFLVDNEKMGANTTEMCRRLNRDVRSAWLRQIRGCEPFSEETFSTLCIRGRRPQLIEPLASVLRDPRLVCEGARYLHTVDWLLFADGSLLEKDGRKIFFDAGGSKFADALNFFLVEYEARGIRFDKVYVWEAKKQGVESYWSGTPLHVRKSWEPFVTFFDGVPVSDEKESPHNPVSKLWNTCDPRDFCVLKLDIDRPTMELNLIAQVKANTRERGHLIDEFFFEHHVLGIMERYAWRGTWNVAGERSNETLVDSLRLFASLRSLGIRAHSWI
eukprot:TRINITY_DN38384_c0_g1_i1.p1 TRINITY_DN38384_c0_g1~~TRINITY_DN38384_c0_g1_i1.p1  ORF type:complete len:709 (+),score=63.71 TRINITY_DN38384_c0_g1_i1:42-2168(+)